MQNEKQVAVCIQGVMYDVSKRNEFSPTESEQARYFRAEKLRHYRAVLMGRLNGRN